MAPGTIILLNGTSSSGKTSLLEALQNRLAEPYLNAGIDKFIWMLPERYLDRPLWDDVLGLAIKAGATGHTLFSGMHHAIRALSRTGNNVIADHVLVELAWADECASLFADLPAYLIGLHCPLDILEAREKARKNRTFGQAKAQFSIIHKYCCYDLELDTSIDSPEVCAEKVIERLKLPPNALRQMSKA